jgi:maleylacetate reductase
MQPFTYEAAAARVVFGHGTIREVGLEIQRLNCSSALVLSTGFQAPLAEDVARRLGPTAVGIFSGAEMHTPVHVTENALEVVRAKKADILVSIGGGSTIGLGKAISIRDNLPHIAIPTTYAGSEATPILGETRDGRKTTLRSHRVVPAAIIYDVDLTIDMPVSLTVTSGINAFAHAAEALYAANANPVTSAMAQTGMAALARSLPAIVRAPHDREARAEALSGAWICGVCLGSAEMSLHHKLCHVLGGAFDLPHSQMHTILLPHTLAYNQKAVPRAMEMIADALGASTGPAGLFELLRRLNAPTALRDIGMPYDGLDTASELATSNPYPNPETVTREGLRSLLERAFHGHSPA